MHCWIVIFLWACAIKESNWIHLFIKEFFWLHIKNIAQYIWFYQIPFHAKFGEETLSCDENITKRVAYFGENPFGDGNGSPKTNKRSIGISGLATGCSLVATIDRQRQPPNDYKSSSLFTIMYFEPIFIAINRQKFHFQSKPHLFWKKSCGHFPFNICGFVESIDKSFWFSMCYARAPVMALHNLKVQSLNKMNSSIWGCDEKTLRKWAWYFILKLLKLKIVSSLIYWLN